MEFNLKHMMMTKKKNGEEFSDRLCVSPVPVQMWR